MSFDFSRFRKQTAGSREINPIKIYDGLPGIKLNDLWRGQYLALNEWHDERNIPSLVLNLNTGGGKTLIGLLQGQSLTNETQGSVFYLCGSNQLIEQTAESAGALKLKVATYYAGEYENEMDFNLGNVQCLTNYQALFNGKSRLARGEITGLIFDDAHVASHIIRDNFTLHISEKNFPSTYATLVGQVRGYFETAHRAQEFDQVVTFKDDPQVLFVPLFVWNEIHGRVIEAMTHEGIASNVSTMFAWEHLRNSIDLCAVFLTSYSIEITPFLPPINELSFMSANTRKIFLTATVQDEPEFVRTFSFLPDKRIEPKTSAGESERLIITPYVNKNIKEGLFEYIVRLSQQEKVLIIPKSEKRAKVWREHEIDFHSTDFAERVREFKSATSGILVAPARFEGMDFPGDTCRLLVIDGLPTGTGLMEKFLWNSLGDVKFLQGTVASRVVQSMGRISRGNDDYGVVFLLGDDIGDWITRSNNRSKLQPYTYAQLELGEELTKDLSSIEDMANLISAVFSREEGWTNIHQEYVYPASITSENDNDLSEEKEVSEQTKIAFAQRKFLKHLWNRDYAKAVRELEQTLNDLFDSDKGLAAWHAHWIGYAYLKGGNTEAANRFFTRAANAYRLLGRKEKIQEPIRSLPIIEEGLTQAEKIAKVLSERGDFNYGSISEMDGRLSALGSEKSSTNEYELALYWLGRYCGFTASRPDKDSEIGRGPDVFWASVEVDISIESKEEKGDHSTYSKRDIGQSLNHVEWYKEEFPESTKPHKLMIVGPFVKAHPAASPSELMNIWLPQEIVGLSAKIRNLILDAYNESDPATFVNTLQAKLESSDLTYQAIYECLPNRLIPKTDSN